MNSVIRMIQGQYAIVLTGEIERAMITDKTKNAF